MVVCGAVLLLLMRVGGIRSTHSGLVGGMLGPLCAVAAVCPAWTRVETGWGRLAVALAAGLVLVLAGWAGALVAKRVEGKQPASAALAWTGASLLLAGLAWNLHGDGTDAPWLAHVAMAMGLVVGALGLTGLTPRGMRPPRTRFGGLLLVLIAVTAVAPFWPSWLPWLLADRNLPTVGSWPPNLLFVALDAPEALQGGPSWGGPASLEVIRAEAVTYPSLFPEPEVGSLLSLPDGNLLASQLHARGFATAAIGVLPESLRNLGIAEVDDRPGGRRMLEESAAWMAGAPLLLGPASSWLGLLGHGGPLRTAEQVGDEAARWLLSWRTTRAPAPFLLFVDLRRADAGADGLDRAMQRILARLHDLALDLVTILVVAVETSASGDADPALRALVLLPSSWPSSEPFQVEPQVWGRALSGSLLEIAVSNGENPVRLVGLPEDLSPPKFR